MDLNLPNDCILLIFQFIIPDILGLYGLTISCKQFNRSLFHHLEELKPTLRRNMGFFCKGIEGFGVHLVLRVFTTRHMNEGSHFKQTWQYYDKNWYLHIIINQPYDLIAKIPSLKNKGE